MFIPKIIVCILGILMGAFLLIEGISLHGYDLSISTVNFGRDFYTEIHKAVRITSSNIGELIELVEKIGKLLLIATGAGFILGFDYKMYSCIAEHKRNS